MFNSPCDTEQKNSQKAKVQNLTASFCNVGRAIPVKSCQDLAGTLFPDTAEWHGDNEPTPMLLQCHPIEPVPCMVRGALGGHMWPMLRGRDGVPCDILSWLGEKPAATHGVEMSKAARERIRTIATHIGSGSGVLLVE
jgi:hypothetical protein